MNRVRAGSIAAATVRDLAGIAAVEHMQRRMTGSAAQHSADHFGAEARSAHAEQHDVLIFPRFGGELAERFQVHGGAAARCQPAEPSILVAAGPQCRVAGPQPPRPALGASPFKPVVDKALQRLGQAGFEPVYPVAEHARSASSRLRRAERRRHPRICRHPRRPTRLSRPQDRGPGVPPRTGPGARPRCPPSAMALVTP